MAISMCADRADTDLSAILVGNSAPMIALRQFIKRVATVDASVMICGESGTGKELVARALHQCSPRAAQNMVAINCGAIPSELLESELFGHEKGSFTGAINRRFGRFEEADGGTLFLDEIGDMPFDMQVKLLRVLEERTISRVGGQGEIAVNVRVISATHQNLEGAIANNRFRQDLFFRLGVILVQMPSLRERLEDIPLLVNHFQRGKSLAAKAHFDTSALNALQDHGWTGNVRELRNVVERADALFGGETLTAVDIQQLFHFHPSQALQQRLSQRNNVVPVSETRPSDSSLIAVPDDDQVINLREVIERFELERISKALAASDGVIAEAAKLLTLKRTTLIEKMRKYGVAKVA